MPESSFEIGSSRMSVAPYHRPDSHPLARRYRDGAQRDQALNGLTKRRATDPELFNQIRLRWEMVTGPQPLLGNNNQNCIHGLINEASPCQRL